MKSYFKFFFLAFLLNFIWEEAHSGLYTGYRGDAITHSLLLFMAVKDALMLLILVVVFRSWKGLSNKPMMLVVSALAVSILIELHALQTGRWGYTEFMPLVPFLGVGLTPTLQLALTGYVSYWIVFLIRNDRVPQ